MRLTIFKYNATFGTIESSPIKGQTSLLNYEQCIIKTVISY